MQLKLLHFELQEKYRNRLKKLIIVNKRKAIHKNKCYWYMKNKNLCIRYT